MNLIYGIKDKPKFGQVVLFAIQQLLAIMAATIAVPAAVNGVLEQNLLSASAALFGAGCGSICYLLFTKSSSPVFLGSSFAFIPSIISAFGGAAAIGLSVHHHRRRDGRARLRHHRRGHQVLRHPLDL